VAVVVTDSSFNSGSAADPGPHFVALSSLPGAGSVRTGLLECARGKHQSAPVGLDQSIRSARLVVRY
jgi:hypothetical protein